MPKDSHVQLTGQVIDVFPSGQFKISLEGGDQSVLARLCGRMRKNRIRVLLGDKVDVSLSPYDLTHGIITFRHK